MLRHRPALRHPRSLGESLVVVAVGPGVVSHDAMFGTAVREGEFNERSFVGERRHDVAT